MSFFYLFISLLIGLLGKEFALYNLNFFDFNYYNETSKIMLNNEFVDELELIIENEGLVFDIDNEDLIYINKNDDNIIFNIEKVLLYNDFSIKELLEKLLLNLFGWRDNG